MKLAYDATLMRPGCVLIAAALGCDTRAAMEFDTKDWLLAPSADMKVYETTVEQLAWLVFETRAHRQKAKADE